MLTIIIRRFQIILFLKPFTKSIKGLSNFILNENKMIINNFINLFYANSIILGIKSRVNS